MASLRRFFGKNTGSNATKQHDHSCMLESSSDDMVVVSKISFTDVDDLVLISNDDSPVNSLAASTTTESTASTTTESTESIESTKSTDTPVARTGSARPTHDVLDDVIYAAFSLIGIDIDDCARERTTKSRDKSMNANPKAAHTKKHGTATRNKWALPTV